MKYDICEHDWNNTIQGGTAPAGLYLTRGDGVAVAVTAEMLYRAMRETSSSHPHNDWPRDIIAKLLEQPK